MAGFGKTPVTTTQTPLPANQVPLSSVAVPGHALSDLTALEGGPASTDSNGNETAPASVYSKDGANITMGLIADAATVGDTSGTLSAKLRGLTKIFNDVWDSTNHRFHVVIDNVTALGQGTMSTSSPVVIASDQSTVPVKAGYTEIAGQGTGVVNGINTDLIPSTDVSAYKWLSLHIEGTWAATLTWQISNDNVNWRGVVFTGQAGINQNSSPGASATSNGIWERGVSFRYLRVRATSWTSNTSLTAVLGLFTQATQGVQSFVNQEGSWTLSANTTGGSTPFHLSSLASTNATNLKNTAGNVYGYTIYLPSFPAQHLSP